MNALVTLVHMVLNGLKELKEPHVLKSCRVNLNTRVLIDARCATAVKKAIKVNSTFLSKITRLIEQGHKTGVRVSSREIIFHMFMFLKPAVRGEAMYDMQDLFSVKLDASRTNCSVHELEDCLMRWDAVIDGMSKFPDEDTMHTLMYGQIKGILLLEFDMKGYERLPDAHKNTSILRSYCDRVIEVERAKENQRKPMSTKEHQRKTIIQPNHT